MWIIIILKSNYRRETLSRPGKKKYLNLLSTFKRLLLRTVALTKIPPFNTTRLFLCLIVNNDSFRVHIVRASFSRIMGAINDVITHTLQSSIYIFFLNRQYLP